MLCPPFVLIVEDNELSASVIKTLLKKQNINTVIASSATEAILLTHDNTFDAIIVDYMLPDGNADEIIPTLRANNPHAYIHAITGDSRDTTIDLLNKIGVVDITFKPFHPETIKKLAYHIKSITKMCGDCAERRTCKTLK